MDKTYTLNELAEQPQGTRFLVWNEGRTEAVIFDNLRDAMWAAGHKEDELPPLGRGMIGVSSLADYWRDLETPSNPDDNLPIEPCLTTKEASDAIILEIAQIIDPCAWKAIEDGRDKLPGSLWEIRRTSALDKARRIMTELVK